MIHGRIKEIIEARSISQTDFASRLGITVQRLNGYLTGRTRPGNDMLVKMADELDITVDYLLGLNYNARPYLGVDENDLSMLTYIAEPDEEIKRRDVDIYLSKSLFDEKLSLEKYATFTMGATHPVVLTSLYAVLVNEESMKPDFLRNDLVFIGPAQGRTNGKLYALKSHKDEKAGVFLRRCVFQDSLIICIPSNKDFLPVVLNRATLGYDPIIGTPVHLIREMHLIKR